MGDPNLSVLTTEIGRFIGNRAVRRSASRLLTLAAAAVLSASASTSAHQQTSRPAHYTTYKGAWFNIDYPLGWKVTSLSQSTTSVTASDSARFTSPDGSAAFYVFSPQWNGNPKEVALDPKREVLVSQRVESVPQGKRPDGSYLYNPVAHWYTVHARDNSYLRSWVDVEDKELNVRHVFGIKYRNKQAYQKYRIQYTHFCSSLEQFSD